MIKKQPLSQLALTALLCGEPLGKPPLIGEVAARPEKLSFKFSFFCDKIKEKSR
jgi:hypothetical protein